MSKSPWSDEAVLRKVREIVAPHLALDEACYWIVDETGIPKQGRHSVGVARQYCGQVGKNENCQVAVSLSLASEKGSLPIAFRLYLPEAWAMTPSGATKRGAGNGDVCDETRNRTQSDLGGACRRRSPWGRTCRCGLWRHHPFSRSTHRVGSSLRGSGTGSDHRVAAWGRTLTTGTVLRTGATGQKPAS